SQQSPGSTKRNRYRLEIERLEERAVPSADIRTYDGTGNNFAHPTWGSDNTDLLRTVMASYTDGISSPAGANRPSARAVSNAVADQPADTPTNNRDMSAFIYAWGQF